MCGYVPDGCNIRVRCTGESVDGPSETASVLTALFDSRGADYRRTRALLQRALAAIYLVAFLVAVNQFLPLLGSHGLTPVPFFLQHVRAWSSPSMFFIHYSDSFAVALAWIGVACAVAAMAGLSERFGTPVSMLVWGTMWLFYLSFVNVGQSWYAFGWETLLCETGFLAIFLGARDVTPPIIVIWLFRWVLFRLMLGAGLIKLRGDPCWRDLTCLIYHYQSQPIPNPLSWYFNLLPPAIDKAGVLFNHFVEVVVPFGILVQRRGIRHFAGAATIALQVMLILSGNFSWLNWITIVIAISCFDDHAFTAVSRVAARITKMRAPGHTDALRPPALAHKIAIGALAAVVAVLSIQPVVNMLSPSQQMNASFEPLHLVNTYGAFGSISRQRLEVVLEGTSDTTITPATIWKEYAFKAKPGGLARRPPIIAPYHLRLDWLMWFAALDRGYADPWFVPLVARLLQNDKATLSLMAANPFPDRPPEFIRARVYEYRFTTAAERKQTGDWWARTLTGEYLPPIRLHAPGLIEALQSQGWVY